MALPFDPSRSVRFDLERGLVGLSDGGPQVLVPAGALGALASGMSDGRSFGRALGLGLMGRAASRLTEDGGGSGSLSGARDAVRRASLESMIDLLGGELALTGLGCLRVERWGKALSFVLDPCSLDARSDAVLAGVFEGALSMVAARDVRAVVVDRSGQSVRLIVGNGEAMAGVEQRLAAGAGFAEVIAVLHGEAERRSE